MTILTDECVQPFNIQESKAVFEEIFNGPTPVFVASLVPEFQSYSHVYWGINRLYLHRHWLYTVIMQQKPSMCNYSV